MVSDSVSKSGQGSVEYLIIIAVVLVIALIVVGLSMFFTSTSTELTQTEVDTYWATQVRPLRILAMQGYYYAGSPDNGELAMVVQNIDSKPIYLTNLILEPYPASNNELYVYSNHSTTGAPATGAFYGYAGPAYRTATNMTITIGPSEKVNLFVRGNVTGYFCNTNNDTLHFRKTLTLQYNTSYFGDIFFTGVKPLQGKCNPV